MGQPQNFQNLALPILLATMVLFSSVSVTNSHPHSEANSDPCQSVGEKFSASLPVPPSEYRSCLSQFPYNPNQSKRILNTILKVLVQIYPYANLAVKSPSSDLPSNICLRTELTRMKNTTYKSDLEFHEELVDVVSALNDGHTRWTPTCYLGVARARTAFPLVRVYDNERNHSRVFIFLDDDLELGASYTHTETLLNTSLGVYKNAEVLKINGIPAIEYAELQATKNGYFRDQQSRMNSMFVRPSATAGSYFFGQLMVPWRLPQNDTIEFTLRRLNSTKTETLHVPYLVSFLGLLPFNSSSHYYQSYCQALPSSVNATGTGSRTNKLASGGHPKYHVPHEKPEMKHRSVPDFADAKKYGLAVLSNSTDHVKVYLLPNSTTAVMTIPDFIGSMVENSSVSSSQAFASFLVELFVGYMKVNDSGASRLIIDLSNNGGGYAATSSFLTQLFFPQFGDPQFLLQFKAQRFAQEAYKQASAFSGAVNSTYNYADYYSTDGLPFESSDSFFLPLVSVTQNNFTSNFSSLFKLGNYRSFFDNLWPVTNLFHPKDILLLSNGLCYSTCANFAYQMKQIHNVRLVTIGGSENEKPFAFSDGSSGFVVMDYAEFYEEEVSNLGLTNFTASPKPLPVQGSLRFTIAQSIGPKSSTIPQEFIFEPGNFKLNYSYDNVFSLPALWKEVDRLF